MKELVIKAEKRPDPDSPDNWDVKIIGLNVQEAKELTSNGLDRNWTIRYTMVGEDTFPCFLLAKRQTEVAASNLAASIANKLQGQAQLKVKTSGKSKVTPGKEHIFTMLREE